MSRNLKDTFSVVANVVVIAFVGFALVRPSGPVGARFLAWQEARTTRALIERNWLEITRGARLDASAAPVMLVEFSDYECPYCRKQHEALAKLSKTNGVGGVVFRHLPLSIHPNAEAAARAAICAQDQGRFTDMHDRLFTTTQWQTDTNWTREAVAAGVPDTSTFRKCLTDSVTSGRLAADKAMADALKINGTPSFVSASGVHLGILDDSSFAKLAARQTGSR